MRIEQPCPKCHRKGLHYCNPSHKSGWTDYNKAECRFCKGIYNTNLFDIEGKIG